MSRPAALPLAPTGAAPAEGAAAGSPRRPALPLTRDAVRELLKRHSEHPSAGMVLNSGNEFFCTADVDGVIAYRPAGGYLFQFGGTFAAPADRSRLLSAFLDFAAQRRQRVCGVQLRDVDLDLYHRHGFRLNQMGLNYTLPLEGFHLRGTKFMKLRNKIKRAAALGVEVVELGRDEPFSPQARADLEQVTLRWVRSKGRFKKLLEFLVGEIGAAEQEGGRCFVARQAGRTIGFITYAPTYGPRAGYIHDLSRRLPECPPGVMELVNMTAIGRFQAEGTRYLHFGFTPFVGVADRAGSHSAIVSTVVRLLGRYGAAVYPAATQVAYKLKWGAELVEPEYFAFQRRFRLGCLWQLLRVTRSI